MFGLGTTELVLILVLALMIFGVGKLPQVAKMLGSGVSSFRKGLSGEEDEVQSAGAKKEEPALLDEEKAAPAASAAAEQQRQAERVESR